jgi:sterol desaturase/sphingolipid hydroxylase (fatty acid hydroxylase superfamily)
MLTTFLADAARAAAWLVILAAIFIPLERVFAERRVPKPRPQRGVDLAYYCLNSTLTVAALASLSGLLATLARHMIPDALAGFVGGLPLSLRVLLTLFVSEFGAYWGHRASHQVPFLWRFHAIHHSATTVDWLTSSRGHPFDLIFTRMCGLTLVAALGLAQPETGQVPVALLLASVFAIVWGFVVHANLRCRLGWLEQVIATPAFHRWHHTNDQHRDHNYASTLPIYDRLFGTLYLPADANPPAFGIDGGMPDGLLPQLVEPLVRRGVRPVDVFRADSA